MPRQTPPSFERGRGDSGCNKPLKKLKAWLLLLSEDELPLTHDLRRLLRLLATHGAAINEWNEIGLLTVYAVQFRYDADPTPLDLDRSAFNQKVRALVLHVEQLLQQSS